MIWYFSYLAVLSGLLVFASPKDRGALWVIFLAGMGSKMLMLFLHSLTAPWKLVFPASVEVLTILALLHFSPNRTGFIQAGLLVVAWGAHVLCYYDLITNSNLVYDNYSTILGWVAVGQIATCYDTLGHNLRAILGWANRLFVVRPASSHASVLHPESHNGL